MDGRVAATRGSVNGVPGTLCRQWGALHPLLLSDKTDGGTFIRHQRVGGLINVYRREAA